MGIKPTPIKRKNRKYPPKPKKKVKKEKVIKEKKEKIIKPKKIKDLVVRSLIEMDRSTKEVVIDPLKPIKKKKPKFIETPSLMYPKIVSAVRQMFRWSFLNKSILDLHKEVYYKGRARRCRYQCNKCKQWFTAKEVQVNHKIPVVPLTGLEKVNNSPDYTALFARLFCPIEDLEVLCKPCHREETNEQLKIRSEHRRDKKRQARLLEDNRRVESSLSTGTNRDTPVVE